VPVHVWRVCGRGAATSRQTQRRAAARHRTHTHRIHTHNTQLTPAYAAAAHAMLGGDGAAAEAFAATLEAQHTSCSGLLHVSSSGSEQEPLAASLAFSMPPAYPGAAALECHVQSSARLPRDTVDALSARLQAQAQAAQVRQLRLRLRVGTAGGGSLSSAGVAASVTLPTAL
jgi:hypothetical protein